MTIIRDQCDCLTSVMEPGTLKEEENSDSVSQPKVEQTSNNTNWKKSPGKEHIS